MVRSKLHCHSRQIWTPMASPKISTLGENYHPKLGSRGSVNHYHSCNDLQAKVLYAQLP